MDHVYIAEKKVAVLCSCKVAKGVQDGFLYRCKSDILWYSSEPMPQHVLSLLHESSRLEEVTDDLAIKLEIAEERWEFLLALKKIPDTVPIGTRVKRVSLC